MIGRVLVSMIAVVDTFQSYPSRDHLRPLATPSRWVAHTLTLISQVPRLPKLGETMFGHTFLMGYGGKGANQAVMISRTGR